MIICKKPIILGIGLWRLYAETNIYEELWSYKHLNKFTEYLHVSTWFINDING